MTRAANDAYQRLIHARQNRPSPEDWAKLQEAMAREVQRERIMRSRKSVA